MSKVRERGYYWVMFEEDSEWEMSYWDGEDFELSEGDCYDEDELSRIFENRINPPLLP